METDRALQALRQVLGEPGFLAGSRIEERYRLDVVGRPGEPPLAVLRPASTPEVSRVLAICHAAGIPVATQGGRTGLVLARCDGADVPARPRRAWQLHVADLERVTQAIDARCGMIVYGHLGDGNLHLSVHQPPDRPETAHAIEQAVYGLVGKYRGSISAEHGIGLLKREFLLYSRTPQEIALMRALKDTLDPRHILNRGRILE